MKRICTLFLVAIVCFASSIANAQLLTWTPPFITETSPTVEIIVDATRGNQGLMNYATTSDVYVHLGAITTLSTSPSDWKYSKFTWATTPATGKATYLGGNKWKYTITGGLRNFFGITNASEKILKIAILFRNGAGTTVQRNTDGSDMYVPVYQAGLYVRIDEPYREPKYTMPAEPINKTLGQTITITARSSASATLKLYFNGTQVKGATNATVVTASPTITSSGVQMIVAEATNASGTKYDTLQFFVTPPQTIAPLPAGVKVGINYQAGDTSVVLVLYAPFKKRAAVIGDFTNWQETTKYQMNKTPDSTFYWVRVTGLTPGVEYGYQYVVEGTDGIVKVADIYAEKVLDPWNDQYIPAANYPNLKKYPTGLTENIVGILQTRKTGYTWQVNNFVKPDKRNLVIYEMLVRDFVATQRWETIKDSIAYLKRLGVNAIEVMPFNEFEGNNSWGYNPDFYFAPDKMYGPENKLRQFIDECHKNGIAVIMDIALNHAFGLSPTVRMYWDAANNKPSVNSPYHNPDAKHPFNVGYDFNHESAATKYLTDRVIEHWLTSYKIDGFRWDLSKGFTQVNSGSDVGAWGNYDASRIAIWKRIYDKMQAVAPKSYCVLEHFAANSEEIELSNYGMLLWGNVNHNFSEATMGWIPNSNFQSALHTNRGWSNPHLIAYMESHDEERVMYRNLNFGNTTNPAHNVRNLATALKRTEMATAFFTMMPGPKMIWQFGELGYDYSINTCEDLTVNSNCRLSPKPIRWDYYTNPNRRSLYNVYSKLLWLRKVPNFLPTFVSSNVSYDLSGTIKQLRVLSDSLKVMVYGNFGVTATTGAITFPNTGTWYNYFTGGSINISGSGMPFNMQPGEYHVYVNRADAIKLVTILPLKLTSFNAQRGLEKIALSWITENEENVSRFIVERSFDGTTFSSIGSVEATNLIKAKYAYDDVDPMTNNKRTVYYRLRMEDLDGKYSYSKVAVVSPSKISPQISVYPNPVKGGALYLRLSGPVQSLNVKVLDATGRVYMSFITTGSSGTIPLKTEGLNNGTYILKAETKDGAYTHQFVIQN